MMKRFLSAFFILLLWVIAGAWVYLCHIKGLCYEKQQDSGSRAEQLPSENVIPSPGVTLTDTLPQEALKTKAENTTAVKETVAFTRNKVLYFGFDSETHKTDTDLQEYIAALKAYLKAHPDKKVGVTGHTDNTGEAARNEQIGLQRARNAMEYLVAQGIPEENIIVSSKGEAIPIASNSTKEGRRRNRRVEITVN